MDENDESVETLSETDFELMIGQQKPSEEQEIWRHLEKLSSDEMSDLQGRVFSSFKPKKQGLLLRIARADKNFPKNLIKQLFEDLRDFPVYNLRVANHVLKIQKFLRLQFQTLLDAQDDNSIKSMYEDPIVRENLIRSYVYEVISSIRNEYFIIHKINLVGEKLNQLSQLVDHFGSIFTAVNTLFNNKDTDFLDEQDIYEAMCNESKEKIWETHFDPFINVEDPIKNTKKFPSDTDEGLLLQSIEAILDSSEYRKIGMNASIDCIVEKLNQRENLIKKNIILSACQNLMNERKKFLGKSQEAKKLFASKPGSLMVKNFFESLTQKISSVGTPEQSPEQSEEENQAGKYSETASVENSYVSSHEESSHESSHEESAITQQQKSTSHSPPNANNEKYVYHFDTSEKNRLLVRLWKEAWDSEKPKTPIGKFFKLIGPTSAKKEISSKINSPISKMRYEKIESTLNSLNTSSDYAELHKQAREFISGWFINSSNLPKKNYTLLKRFEMTLDYCAYSSYVDNFKLDAKLSEANKKPAKSNEERSTESISISTPRQNELAQDPLKIALLQISDEIKTFLKNSRKLQNGKQKHTGLKFIEKYMKDHPVNEDNIGYFYAQTRAISDQRLSASGLFIDLFRKKIGRDGNAQEFYKLFKSTSLMTYDVKTSKLVPNISNINLVLSGLQEMNQQSKNKLEAKGEKEVVTAKDFLGRKR
jgi:hypothetical protein